MQGKSTSSASPCNIAAGTFTHTSGTGGYQDILHSTSPRATHSQTCSEVQTAQPHNVMAKTAGKLATHTLLSQIAAYGEGTGQPGQTALAHCVQ